MCGIAGVYGRLDAGLLDDMLSCLTHRGPDEGGTHVDRDHDLAMGMRRLSIVDLSGGTQPIYNEEGTVAVVFNGEIYNHEELRDDLTAAGHTFSTDSDTEVLVHLWEEHGERTPEFLNGMFAFSVWDAEAETLFVARDRLGIKPLYYADTDDRFLWASELRPLLRAGVDRTLDEAAVYNYFSLRYSPGRRTLFSSVEKLEPGTSLTVTADGVRKRRYWRLTADSSAVSGGFEAAARRVRDLLETSVRRRLMADVPLGAFLSGGLDSSAVVGLASEMYEGELKTFSVGFEGATYDESDEARFVADHFGTDHHELRVDLSSMDAFSTLVTRYGEPLADPAALPTMLLSEYASEEVKVVLTGEGADELFAGYDRHRLIPRHRETVGRFPAVGLQVASSLERHAPFGERYLRYVGSLGSDSDAVLGSARRFSDEPPEAYLRTDLTPETSGLTDLVERAVDTAREGDTQQAICAFDIAYWLPDNLLYKVDRASMAHSLEARVPFLDHELVEYAYSVPSEYKTRGYKSLLTAAVSDVVPDRTLERDKHGFDVPVVEWFRDRHPAIERWLADERLDRTPYLETDVVRELYEAHYRGTADHAMTLWKVLSYVAWHDEFVASEAP